MQGMIDLVQKGFFPGARRSLRPSRRRPGADRYSYTFRNG